MRAQVQFKKGSCTPTVYLDGHRANAIDLNADVAVRNLAAVEIYPTSHVDPAGGGSHGCSNILWSGPPF